MSRVILHNNNLIIFNPAYCLFRWYRVIFPNATTFKGILFTRTKKRGSIQIPSLMMGDNPPAAVPVAVKSGGNEAGREVWLNTCSGCHSRDGEGKPNVSVGMINNATVRQPDGRNLIVSVLDGLPAQNFPGGQSMQSMPGFAHALTDQQIADLVNYMRVTWGGQPANITADQVKALR
jgi:mono/diheme cytochrome c family protein